MFSTVVKLKCEWMLKLTSFLFSGILFRNHDLERLLAKIQNSFRARNFLLAIWKFHHSVYRMIMYWLYRRSEYYFSLEKVIETRAGRLLKRRLWEAEFRADFLLAILKFHRSYRMSVHWLCKKSEYFFKLDWVMELRVDSLTHSLTPWTDDDIFQIFPWN